jgi:hypothetical protein
MSTADDPSTSPGAVAPELDAPVEPPVAPAPTPPPPSPAARPSTTLLRVLAWIVLAAGIVLIAAGAVTWFVVRDQLADEKIVVSSDADYFAGDDVDGPLTAYSEAGRRLRRRCRCADDPDRGRAAAGLPPRVAGRGRRDDLIGAVAATSGQGRGELVDQLALGTDLRSGHRSMVGDVGEGVVP